jgi:hypothetical protein
MMANIKFSSLDGADDYYCGAFEHDLPAGMADGLSTVESRDKTDFPLEGKEYKLIN